MAREAIVQEACAAARESANACSLAAASDSSDCSANTGRSGHDCHRLLGGTLVADILTITFDIADWTPVGVAYPLLLHYWGLLHNGLTLAYVDGTTGRVGVVRRVVSDFVRIVRLTGVG